MGRCSSRKAYQQWGKNRCSENKLDNLTQDVKELKTDVKELKEDVKDIKLALGWLKWIGGAIVTIALALVANGISSIVSNTTTRLFLEECARVTNLFFGFLIMNLRAKIGQMIVVRASGYLFDRQRRYPAWEADNQTLQRWLRELNIGGVILLGGSAIEVKARSQQLQSWANIPLLIAADIEEGVGQRFLAQLG